MIIDTHVHCTRPGFVRSRFLGNNSRMAASLYNRVHKTSIKPEDYALSRKLLPHLFRVLDSAGIDIRKQPM